MAALLGTWTSPCHRAASHTMRSCGLETTASYRRPAISTRRHRSTKRTAALLKHTIRVGRDGIELEPMIAQDKRQAAKTRQFFAKCEFLYSAAELRQHPINNHAIPEILVLGASNVGKSSLLNSLFDRKDMARASKEPGKTTLMNAYGIGKPVSQAAGPPQGDTKVPRHGLILMDTPGYGFGSRTEWGANILTYIEKRKAFRGALLLISAEKKLNDEDRWILEQLAAASARVTVILTRADKLGSKLSVFCSQMALQVLDAADSLEQSLCLKIPIEIYAASAHSAGDGVLGGIGGLRSAILDMAGIQLGETTVEQTKETVKYTGKVVSFDDIQWKT